ncbi:MAG: right-handed parallel beta-helix repeat-containing protein [Chloroflexi bacterium]|nr:right-handed parallel beta-helix repeat-containing protein [Chloroflexota bacterium]
MSISATVGSPDDSTVLVDLELSDAQGTKVGQQFWDAQAFAAGQTRSYSWDWQVPPTTPAGTYTLKLVIFSPGWGSFVQYFESPAPLQVAASCSNVSLQSLVDAAQAGSVLDVPPCVYRETVYVNKPLTLLGHGQATIKGSDIWNDWTQNGKLYLSSQTVPVFQTHGECATSDNRCLHAEQVYLDGHPLRFVLNGSPSTGQFALDGARHVVLADNPTGHQVEVTTRTAWILGQADGVTVDGFTMADAANDAQTGALSNGRHANWTIQNNNLSAAHGWVVDLSGNGGLQAQNNDISLGGQLGLGSDHATGLVLHANKIHDNNTDGFDTLWEAGGVKMAAENGVVIDNNAFYGNAGPGLWADLGCQKVTFSNNSIYNNQGMGILFEISNQGQIFGNRIWNNATAGADWGWGAGIVVSSSANTEVYQNTLAWNPGGISVISQDRGGGLSVAGIHVHDNTMIVSTQKSSVGSHLRYALEWLQDWNGPLFDPNADNHGTGNAYWFPGPEDDQVRFAWNGPLDHLDDFNNTPGGAHGTYLSDGQKDAILSAQGIPATPASAAEAGASS